MKPFEAIRVVDLTNVLAGPFFSPLPEDLTTGGVSLTRRCWRL